MIMFLTGKFIFLFCAWLKSSFTTDIGWFFCMFFAAKKKKKKKKSLIKDLLLSICLIKVVTKIS
jgi:hypothetical protein